MCFSVFSALPDRRLTSYFQPHYGAKWKESQLRSKPNCVCQPGDLLLLQMWTFYYRRSVITFNERPAVRGKKKKETKKEKKNSSTRACKPCNDILVKAQLISSKMASSPFKKKKCHLNIRSFLTLTCCSAASLSSSWWRCSDRSLRRIKNACLRG